MGFFSRFAVAVAIASLVPRAIVVAVSNEASSSPVLAGPVGKHCVEGAKYEGTARGKNVTIAGVPTYLATPKGPTNGKTHRVIIFLSDIYGPFYENNFLQQDYFATKGYHVLGIDYFLGDPIGNHDLNDPNFNATAWVIKSQAQAEEVLPKWINAVRSKYGSTARYTAVGYCFGAPYATEAAATDWLSAVAFAHPSNLKEQQVINIKKPLLLSCAEADATFSTEARRRTVDLLIGKNATYHHQVFSGVTHGFATRADPADLNAVWAKDESARSVIGWFDRFTL
ncbi:Alpha/Beta hydrolase protein [Coprinopsis sp. MPI-PUGE-AT-0042]|nr:Alpha/Beta hydrolase protein [Coprinopsis sp. MPI-PUGE-AT-0042]